MKGGFMKRHLLAGIPLLLVLGVPGLAGERVASIEENEFERLQQAITPQRGESPWREIAWETNITEARRRATQEDKPLVIFTAADGSPLSRT
jgi:hypothetical protein